MKPPAPAAHLSLVRNSRTLPVSLTRSARVLARQYRARSGSWERENRPPPDAGDIGDLNVAEGNVVAAKASGGDVVQVSSL